MRKSWMVLAALACLAVMATTAVAETASVGDDMKGQVTVGLQGGIVLPMGKLAEDVDLEAEEGIGGFQGKMGFGGGLCVDYFITKEFALGLDGSYATFESDYADAGDAKATTMQFGLHGKYMVPTGGPMVPYLFVGGGMYNAKLTDIGMDDLSQTKFGVNGGVGVGYKINDMVSLGVNGAYHMALGEFKPEIDGTEVVVLDDWSYMTFNAGVTFQIPMGK